MRSKKELEYSQLWLGSEEDLRSFVEVSAKWKGTTPEAAGVVLDNKPKVEEGPESRLLTIAHGVGLISIEGRLVSEDNWWNQYAGLVSYNEIRVAALEALITDSVKEVILDISSPGGQVAGIFDAVDSLVALGHMKRLTAYSDSVAASGGLWLFSTAKDRFASPVASIGSIGVIQVHMEYTKMLAEDGVTPTVLRAGKYKALGNPYEKLGALAKTEMDAQLEHVYGVFVQSVADNMETSYQAVDSHMAQGRVFIGSQAVDAGLVDSVSSFDKVYATVVTRVASKGDDGMKKRMTQGSLQAAAALGALSPESLAAVEGAPELTTDVKLDVEGTPAEVKLAESKPGESETKEPDAKAEGNKVEEGTPAEPTAMDLLKSQVAELNDKVVDLKVELKGSVADATELAAAMAPLKEVVANAVNNMAVALDQPVDKKLAEASVEDILARHTSVSDMFTEQYKVGGVGSPSADVEPEKTEAPRVNSFHSAAVKASKVVPMTR